MPRHCSPTLITAATAGLPQGVLLFGTLLAIERLALGGDYWSALGSPLAIVLSVYFVTGAVCGIAAGVAAWLVARHVRLATARLSLSFLVVACVLLFAVRSTPASDLAKPSPRNAVLVAAAAGLLTLGAWWARRRGAPAALPHRVRFAGAAGAALACGIALAWTPARHHHLATGHRLPPDAPNVVFVVVDALRFDRLSCFGYSRPTSPFVDRLASSGAVFTHAYAHGNRTIFSVPSLFTSKYPSYARPIRAGHWEVPLPEAQTTLAEMFRDAGYTTLAMMANPYLRRPFGLTQGFERVEEFNAERFRLSLYRMLVLTRVLEKPRYASGFTASATEVTNAAITWLQRVPRDSPFFCYTHYMDVHHPYLPPGEFEHMFNSDPRPAQIDPEELFDMTLRAIRENRRYALKEDQLARLGDLYDGCIRYVDSEIQRLVETAAVVNGRPTYVVVTADHGDEFQEHGCLYHTNVVIEELIRVPLVIWRSDHPQRRRIDEVVRHIDILPTMAEWIHAPLPPDAMGRTLNPCLDGRGAAVATSLVAQGDYCSAVLEPGWKLMRIDSTSATLLFDLSADPGADHDVARSHPGQVSRLMETLDLYFEGVPRMEPESFKASAATLDQLRTLGYIR